MPIFIFFSKLHYSELSDNPCLEDRSGKEKNFTQISNITELPLLCFKLYSFSKSRSKKSKIMAGKNYDVTAVGELLVDMISTDRGADITEAHNFKMASGGGVANVAVGCARLGLKTAFIGKVGDDPFGRFLEKELRANGVYTEGLKFSKEHSTPIVFVTLDCDAKPSFYLYGMPGADLMLEKSDIALEIVTTTRILHFSTVTMTMEPARSATIYAVQSAKSSGAMISYDPNIRLHMWKEKSEALYWAGWMLLFADIVKLNEEEAELLVGTGNAVSACMEILDKGAQVVAVTLGEKGVYFATKKFSGSVKAPKVNVVDTTGAGDAFMAGLLKGISESGATFFEDAGNLKRVMQRACSVAALSTEAIGAVSAMPNEQQLETFLKERMKQAEEK